MKKRVLITGVNGFTGRYMAAEMNDAGYEVFGLAHSASSKSFSDSVALLFCDLCDRTKLSRIIEEVCPDFVVHLASIAFVAHGDAEAIYRTNIVGTRNLLECLARNAHTPRSILLASSANIYGNATTDLIGENTIAAPANDYAVSKLAMEYMAKLWADRLPVTIVRPFNYTGVGQSLDFLLPKIADHFKRRAAVLELGNLDVVRDFSDVRSVVSSYHRLLEIAASGETFNVCSGIGYSLLEVLQMMRDITGHHPEIRVNPAFVRANEVHRLIGSRAKLDSVIGKIPAIPLQETVQWMLDGTP
ncbi:MAG: GDP-mannose 4,6-dehydratase [Burkholderiales bacterium]